MTNKIKTLPKSKWQKEFDSVDIPVFKMSKRREKIALKAIEDYKSGRTKPIKDLDKYFNDL